MGDEESNLRTNSSQEGGNDEDIGEGVSEGIQGLGGPMTRARAKKAKEALNQNVANLIKGRLQN